MLNLIKLEIKKYKLNGQIKGVTVCILCLIAFLTLFLYDTFNDPVQDRETFESVLWIINILTTGIFLIYSSVIMSEIAIGEYQYNTIMVMFSYPISRRKIMLSKLIIVSLFAMSCIFIGDVICSLYIIIVDSFLDVIVGDFNIKYVFDMFAAYLGSIAMGGILSLLPFTFGMRKKKGSAAIVSCVIIVFLMQPIIGRDPEFKSTLIKLVAIALISLIVVLRTLNKKVNNLDGTDVV